MKKMTILFASIAFGMAVAASEKQPLWPEGGIVGCEPHQVAASVNEIFSPNSLREFEQSKVERVKDGKVVKAFSPADYRMPHLRWSDRPANASDVCVILISGGGYWNTCDETAFRPLEKKLLDNGIHCVWLWYRTPYSLSGPRCKTAWIDGQRAVRLVRSQAAKRGFHPEKIGVLGCSAGSHLSLMLGTSALTPAYARTDAIDDLPCHINFALPMCPAYVMSDGFDGRNSRDGDAPDLKVDPAFKFDAKTCPMCFFHGHDDPYSPNGSTQVYRQLRRMKIPAELHLDPKRGHGPVDAAKFERAIEFLRQLEILGKLEKPVPAMEHFSQDAELAFCEKQNVWPDGRMPDVQTNQCLPYIEWFVPKTLKTKAIQIIYSGGGYFRNSPDGFEVVPTRRYLNSKGMAVVTMKYRSPRPHTGIAKHVTAWQDVQRAIRLVRSQAESHGLDPNRIGVMGSSAGGHLTLMAATSSKHQAYNPIDRYDRLSCSVQWAIAIYPAYSLTDGAEVCNVGGGNADDARLAPEFSFDLATPPMLFLHGDADSWAAMNSVKCWEQLRRMGIQGELHTFALRKHCFQKEASPGTGSYTWNDRIWDFFGTMGINK